MPVSPVMVVVDFELIASSSSVASAVTFIISSATLHEMADKLLVELVGIDLFSTLQQRWLATVTTSGKFE